MGKEYLDLAIAFYILGVPTAVVGWAMFRSGPFLVSWIYNLISYVAPIAFFAYLLRDELGHSIGCQSALVGVSIGVVLGMFLRGRIWGEYSIMNADASKVHAPIEESLEAMGVPFELVGYNNYRVRKAQGLRLRPSPMDGSIGLIFDNWYNREDKRRFLSTLSARLWKVQGPFYKLGGFLFFSGVGLCIFGTIFLL